MRITQQANDLSERTSDAYSYDRYRNWTAVCQMLLNRGYTELEAEAILRSKWTRWACDQDSNRYGCHTSKALARFVDTCNQTEVKELVIGTFGYHKEPA